MAFQKCLKILLNVEDENFLDHTDTLSVLPEVRLWINGFNIIYLRSMGRRLISTIWLTTYWESTWKEISKKKGREFKRHYLDFTRNNSNFVFK